MSSPMQKRLSLWVKWFYVVKILRFVSGSGRKSFWKKQRVVEKMKCSVMARLRQANLGPVLSVQLHVQFMWLGKACVKHRPENDKLRKPFADRSARPRSDEMLVNNLSHKYQSTHYISRRCHDRYSIRIEEGI